MYTIQGIIADRNIIEPENVLGAKIVALLQDMVLIPFAGAWIDEKEIPLLPLTDGGVITLPTSIAGICHLLSKNGKVAYVEAEFFGGVGSQACSLWDKGIMIGNPQLGLHAINTALQFLGVEKGSSFDEFEALNLGRFRETEAWLSGDGA
jgi:hypothetical protein